MSGAPFKKILVPVDFSACSDEALRVACSLARIYQSEVLILHVVDTEALGHLNRLGLALPSEEAKQKKRLRHHARLNARRLLRSDDAKGLNIGRMILEGSAFVEIARTARTEKSNLIVMGSYGGQGGRLEKMFFGSTAEQVVRTAACPVLCVPLPARPSTTRTINKD